MGIPAIINHQEIPQIPNHTQTIKMPFLAYDLCFHGAPDMFQVKPAAGKTRNISQLIDLYM